MDFTKRAYLGIYHVVFFVLKVLLLQITFHSKLEIPVVTVADYLPGVRVERNKYEVYKPLVQKLESLIIFVGMLGLIKRAC